MRAAIYCRISGMGDERTASLDSQAEEASALARKDGFEVGPDDVYQDRFTGVDLHNRPELNRMREHLRQGRYQSVYVYSLDRLARDTNHQGVLYEEAKRFDAIIKSVSEPNIDETPVGRHIRYVYGFLAELEREKILDRTRRGTRKILESGKPVCAGVARYGYQYAKETRTRVVVDHEAAIVKRIFKLAAEGLSTRKIAECFNGEGIPSPGEGRGRTYKDGRISVWTKASIHAILKDSSYTGEPMRAGKTKVTGQKKSNGRSALKFQKAEDQLILKDPTPLIIERKLFDQVQEVLATRQSEVTSRNHRKARLLRGMVFCAKCGRTMTTQSIAKWKKEDGRYEFYLCMSGKGDRPDDVACGNGRTHIDRVDEAVWEKVRKLISDPAIMEAEFKAAMQDGRATQTLRDEIEVRRLAIEKAKTKIRRLMNQFAADEDETVAEALNERLEGEKLVIRSETDALELAEARLASLEHQDDAMRRFVEVMQTAGRELKKGVTFTQKRAMLEALGTTVTLDRNQVTVRLLVSPSCFSNAIALFLACALA